MTDPGMAPRLRRVAVLSALTFSILLAAPAVQAGPATDQLRNRVDRILQVLSDPEMAKESRTAERRMAIRRIAGEVFDFNEISRRSLGRYWQPRTPAERDEFVRLFADLLERAYVSKLELYSGEKIEYPGEVPDGDVTTVRTRIITKQGTPIPVDYRMFQQSGQWRAYDALIEGVSLVANYRSQFNSVIQRTSYEDLVKTLRAKAQEGAPPPGKAPAGSERTAPTSSVTRPQTP
jgi:phospholipid transport system substrate-binding protein